MPDYTIYCPTHQPHSWYLEFHCDQTENYGTNWDCGTALEMIEFVKWKMEHYHFIKSIDIYMDGKWYGCVKRDLV